MHYVYLLRSKSYPKEKYIGSTNDLKTRFLAHNRGDSPHTAKFMPWERAAYFAFREKSQAIAFEQYLKTGSGRAFAKAIFRNRRILSDGVPTTARNGQSFATHGERAPWRR